MRVLMILESKNIEFQAIDITEPGKEPEKEFMQLNSSARDSKYPLPPQIFNEEEYCGVSSISITILKQVYLDYHQSLVFK